MEPDRFDYTETPAGVDPVDADEALLEKTGLEVIGFDAVDRPSCSQESTSSPQDQIQSAYHHC